LGTGVHATQPVKRRGNRRYYQHHEVLLIRRIRDLLYEQGFTISGARNRLADGTSAQHTKLASVDTEGEDSAVLDTSDAEGVEPAAKDANATGVSMADAVELSSARSAANLIAIRGLLTL